MLLAWFSATTLFTDIGTNCAPPCDVNSVVVAKVVTTGDVAMLLPGNRATK